MCGLTSRSMYCNVFVGPCFWNHNISYECIGTGRCMILQEGAFKNSSHITSSVWYINGAHSFALSKNRLTPTVLYNSSSLGKVKNFRMLTPFSSNNLTKSVRSCSKACIMASSSAPLGHSCPYTKISERAMSTRFHVSARLSCSLGERCWLLNRADRIVWSSSCDVLSGRSDMRNTVIYTTYSLAIIGNIQST